MLSPVQIDRLERLRREQQRRDRPALRLPVGPFPRDREEGPERAREPRGEAIIDFSI